MEGGGSNPGPLAPRSICPEVVCEKDHGSLDLSQSMTKGQQRLAMLRLYDYVYYSIRTYI